MVVILENGSASSVVGNHKTKNWNEISTVVQMAGRRETERARVRQPQEHHLPVVDLDAEL